MEKQDNRIKILESTIRVFNQKGLKFTMDDIAADLSMSKKTIYKTFRDKESMFFDMVDYCFDNIKEYERAIIEDESLTTIEKLRSVLGVMPEGYRNIDFRQLYILKDKYPKIYRKVEHRLENEWEATLDLLNKGMEEGVIRKVNPIIFKTIMESTLEQFFQRDILVLNNITYMEALDELVNIMMEGIRKI